jgi:type IV pilus assembly protein PilY1
MNTNSLKTQLLTCSAAVFSLLPLFVQADDTEIYTGIAERDAPNVIFIMDTSGSMSWANDGSRNPPAGESRLEQVQEAAIDTINNTDGINISLMRFNKNNSGYGGYIDLPMTPVAEARSDFETKMNGYTGTGGTPITETLGEAVRYLQGASVLYGEKDGTYYSDSASRDGNTYKSPISHQCQKNHIVLFSDGVPSSDQGLNSSINTVFNALSAEEKAIINSNVEDCGSSSGSCAEEFALLANMTDLSTDYDDIQNVTFHAVGGFVQGSAQTKLENIAKYGSWAAPGKPVNPAIKEGSGVYANVQSYDELKQSLKDIFDAIAKTSSTFTAPAVSVNAFNSLEHLDELYYSVFKPTDSAGWSGNLKRYRLTTDGEIFDSKDQPAVNPDTGFFFDESHSYWTLGALADGSEVKKGGAASRLTATRTVTTYFGPSKRLDADVNAINEENVALTSSLLSLPPTYTPDQKTKLIKWAKGIDVNDEDNDSLKDDARAFMEDPLHSQPIVINYAQDADNNTIDSTIFIATNSGFLHAFSSNEDDPEEYFSFIPKELLPNLYQYFTGLSSLDKVYGLDGPISYWHKDTNFNGVILDGSTIETGEHIYLYMGMRRGGRSYYALDISDRTKPEYLWQIDHTTSGFSKLGQTWSKMTPASVNWLGTKTDVLFFGGGYDPAEDDKISRSESTMGNAIFMVKAATGELLWSSSNSDATLNIAAMKNSIVANIVPIDSTLDGYTNILYTADVGGRVWRIDLDNNAASASAFAKGGVIADFNGDSNATNIRFFNTPDIAFTRYGNFSAEGQFQISIGSGFRAHPLNTLVVDRFYIINDINVTSVPASYTDYKENDLADTTDFSSASSIQKEAGSYYKLTLSGEKVLSNSITVANNVFFTTYRPLDAASSANCDADTGSTRLYQIVPTYDDDSRSIDITDLAQGGIPPNPVILFPPSPTDEPGDEPGDEGVPSSKSVTVVGAEVIENDFSIADQLSKTYWLENK